VNNKGKNNNENKKNENWIWKYINEYYDIKFIKFIKFE
jgi:hypothetical protein